MVKTRAQYREHGSHFGSGEVSLEAHEVAKRWQEDLETLKLYGYSQGRLDTFMALVAKHDALRVARPDTVTSKLQAVQDGAGTVRDARAWLDRAFCNLTVLGLDDEVVGKGVDGIKALKRDGLDAMVGACVAQLKEHKAKLPLDTEPDGLIAAGEELVPKLKALNPDKASAKGAVKADTEELDVMDGRLLTVMSGLNNAGRKAFRKLGMRAKVASYRYHHLSSKPSETGKEAGGGEDNPSAGAGAGAGTGGAGAPGPVPAK